MISLSFYVVLLYEHDCTYAIEKRKPQSSHTKRSIGLQGWM